MYVYVVLYEVHIIIRGSLHESGLSFNPERYLIQTQFVFTWENELRTERSRRMKISFPIETRFRFMCQQSYFSGDFST